MTTNYTTNYTEEVMNLTLEDFDDGEFVGERPFTVTVRYVGDYSDVDFDRVYTFVRDEWAGSNASYTYTFHDTTEEDAQAIIADMIDYLEIEDEDALKSFLTVNSESLKKGERETLRRYWGWNESQL